MISFAVAFGLLLHAFFWGVGLAILAMPQPWRRFWPVLVFPAGFALQSLVVWLGAYGHLHGTNSYAWASELIPAALLTLGWRRIGGRRFRLELGNFGLVGIIMAGALLLLVLPLALATKGLSTTSLGSCDAADYAAGARVFMEFGRNSRVGFLGLREVVQVMSADNFYDFWLRLNHFTPSALMALNGSILHCAPHQTAGLLTMVVLVASIPLVFWIARALLGYSSVASLIIAAVYGISPITWYSVAQVSPAPLLAAMAIAALNWAAIALWRTRLSWRRGREFIGVLMIAYAIILGAYNFILVVALVPAVAYAGGTVLATREWRRFARWWLILVLPLALAGLVFWDRVAGMVERFMLFQTYDFGWRIPILLPDGWLGMVRGGDLQPWHWAGLRWLLAAVGFGAFAWAVGRAMRHARSRVWIVASVTAPVLVGYAYLEVRGALRGTNASYDAFKLFAVFYPLLLPAFCWWITLRWSWRLSEWLEVALLAAVVVAFNLAACAMCIYHLSQPPLSVDGELRQIRRIEGMPDVRSVNMLIPDMWSRLWANELLLRKRQYFASHTYEGRLNTPLRGEWDLVSGPVRLKLPAGGTRAVTTHYWLIDTRAPGFVRLQKGDGWYAEERAPNGVRWSWTAGDATVHVDNPQDHPVVLQPALDGRSLPERPLTLTLTSAGTAATPVKIGEERTTTRLPPVTVPPGRSVLTLHLAPPPAHVAGDSRPLGICVFELSFVPVEAGEGSEVKG